MNAATPPPSGPPSDPPFDVAEADRLLMTTRAVRRRLDFDREVPDQVILDCIDAAEQTPSGGNNASRRWIVVRNQAKKDRLAELYYRTSAPIRDARASIPAGHDKERVWESSAYLSENFAKAPALVIAAIWGVHDGSGRPGLFDSVIQAGWSFNLALRARGLGSTWTTMLNANVDELAAELGIPDGVTTIVTFPVAYTVGTDFSPAPRQPATEITYFDEWGFTRAQGSTDGTARVADGPGVVAEADISASRETVWRHVSDINAPAKFSGEFQGAEWTSGSGEVGSTFAGRNKMGEREWEVQCHVTVADSPAVFEWATTDPDDPGARWRMTLNEIGDITRLTFSMQIGERHNGTATRALQDPDKEEEVLAMRRSMLKTNMQATVDGIKGLAEADTE